MPAIKRPEVNSTPRTYGSLAGSVERSVVTTDQTAQRLALNSSMAISLASAFV
jgi:hypothetical protein